jgi:hypothetical protein
MNIYKDNHTIDNHTIDNHTYLANFLKLYQNKNKNHINISNKELHKFIEYLINNNIFIINKLEKIENEYDKINYKIYQIDELSKKLYYNLNIFINLIILFGIFNLILVFSIYILFN